MSYLTSIRKNFILFLVTIGIINTFLAVVSFFYFKNQQNELLYNSKLDMAKSEFIQTYNSINYEIEHYKLILNTLKNTSDLQRVITNDKSTLNYLNKNFNNFVKANKNIFQLRFLDKNGNEIIRVEKKDNEVNLVENFQNKAKRYYFLKTKNLKDNQFYISDFDLNIEHGKIQTPYKPTIRISTPIYLDEHFEGILIINFLASDLINAIKDKKDFDVYFMDKDKNFLIHPDESKSWSTQKGTNFKVKDEIPNIDALMQNKNMPDKNWLFYINKVDITDNGFCIIYSIKDEVYKDSLTQTSKNISLFFFIVFIVSIPFILMGAYFQSIRMKILMKIIDSIPFPICLKDKKGVFILVNDALAKLYGFSSKKQLLGKNSYSFANEKLPYTSKTKDIIALKKQKIEFIHSVNLNNEKTIHYEIKIMKISFLSFFNKNFILGVAIDVTSMRTLNDNLQSKINKEVEIRLQTQRTLIQKARLAELGNMIDNIIHQWKQPLSVIRLGSQALEMDLDFGTLQKEQKSNYIKTIIENVDFMSETADDFRSFLSPQKIKSEFLLVECAQKILKLLTSRSKKLNVVFKNELDKNTTIYGYKNELSQVLLNILNNALDEFENKIELNLDKKEVKISCQKQNDKILIFIEDNAGGIKKDFIKKIFEERFTTKEETGTGIGLTISKRIIEESFNGTIEVQNKNNGAIFTITISLN